MRVIRGISNFVKNKTPLGGRQGKQGLPTVKITEKKDPKDPKVTYISVRRTPWGALLNGFNGFKNFFRGSKPKITSPAPTTQNKKTNTNTNFRAWDNQYRFGNRDLNVLITEQKGTKTVCFPEHRNEEFPPNWKLVIGGSEMPLKSDEIYRISAGEEVFLQAGEERMHL